MTTDAKGMTMSVLRRHGDEEWPSRVTVVGVLTSHDQDVVDDLPQGLRVSVVHGRAAPPVALEVRALFQTTEHRQIVAVPVDRGEDGQWRRTDRLWQASGAYVVCDDSRMSTLLTDLSGYAYDPAVPLHDRNED